MLANALDPRIGGRGGGGGRGRRCRGRPEARGLLDQLLRPGRKLRQRFVVGVRTDQPVPHRQHYLLQTPGDAKMDHVRKATVRDLRYHFPEIENLLQEGEEVQITKRKRVIGRLVPEVPAAPVAMPDFMAMLREIYGNKKLKVTGADLVRADRDRY